MSNEVPIRKMVSDRFRRAGLTPTNVDIRSFPGETIVVVEVDRDYDIALRLAKELDSEIENGFVTVRQRSTVATEHRRRVESVHDGRMSSLIELMSARSRTSESQPSLRYVQDVDERLNVARSLRHHLVFGRRGVGKTSLLLEAKRLLEGQGAYALWVNIHALRDMDAQTAFLTIGSRLADLVTGAFQRIRSTSNATQLMKSAREHIDTCLALDETDHHRVSRLVPLLQQALSRFCMEVNQPLYIFLDDVHYLPPQQVPQLLDLLLRITRDNPVWLKVAGIQHQTRWFVPDPPTGLQTGHDASIISLDVTLEKPERAKEFLLSILRGYVEEVNAVPISGFISSSAIDRLVLASGGVPRDFLTLCATSLQTARQRSNARTIGVQDVNTAAGIAAGTKLQELEDDAAAARGRSEALVAVLNTMREYLLNDQQITFFRIDFRDKEAHSDAYSLIQALADLRMLHLINASLSDPHQAGRRSEVYLLDLSQYSGSRLKHNLSVLDFEKGHMVMKRTRTREQTRIGDTARRLVSVLRRGPVFELSKLE